MGIIKRLDGSYVITKNGYPYHVTQDGDTADEWAAVNAYAKAHPEEVTEVTPPPAPTLAEMKEAKKAELARARYSAETGGITFAGAAIRTDRESQSLITGAALAATQDPGYSVVWKVEGGFVTLTAEQIIAAAQAVRAHVEACFVREAELSSAVDAAKSAKAVRAIEWSLSE